MRYLLDTNIVSALVRDPGGPVAQRVAQAGRDAVCTSIFVTSELRFGAARRGSSRLEAQLEAVLRGLHALPFESPGDSVYAELRLRLERAGTPIGGTDTFIAAHALALGLTLVTDNEREFRRVENLLVENWLR